MIKIIWRQFVKNRKILIPIILIWIVLGYYIFSNQHYWFAGLSRWWLELPEPGEQKPYKAWSYYQDAINRIADNQIDLNLMNKSCEEFLPIRITEDIAEYRPHWLDKLRNWENLEVPKGDSLDARSVEPDEYWSSNQGYVLASLKDILDATNYAWEIEADVHEQKNNDTILLPIIFSDYARTLCQPGLARLVWGDYAEFQEIRAWKSMENRQREFSEYDFNKRIQISNTLKLLHENARYIHALQEYATGYVPEEGDENRCQSRPFSLNCAAPQEAIEVYQKLIIVTDSSQKAWYHLKLAKVAWYVANKGIENQKHIELAKEHFHYSLQYNQTERESLFALSNLYLQQDDPGSAYEMIKRLQIQSNQQNFPIHQFNELARSILIKQKRFEEADCYAPLSDNRYGRRGFCLHHQL